MSNQANESQYFDLHTTGIGYLNRIREVKPKGRGAKPFLAVAVAALCGSKEAVEYRYIDCNVVGAEAEKLVRRCIDAVNIAVKDARSMALAILGIHIKGSSLICHIKIG